MISVFGLTFGKQPTLASFDAALNRERLIQNGRIVVIDDENPLIIEDLQKTGFAVDHDKVGDDLGKYDAQIYDVAIIDFHGVGKRLGDNHGLDLLKHIRRVSPRTRLIAYTSRSLNASESEFFRLSHVVLPKDMGLTDSIALIENQLRLAFTKEHLFESLTSKLNMTSAVERQKIQQVLLKSLGKHDEKGFRDFVTKTAGEVAGKSVEYIIDRIFP